MSRKLKHVVIISAREDQGAKFSQIIETGDLSSSVFTSPLEAIDYIRTEEPPDLFVIDLHLPAIDGWKLCRLLRSSEFKQVNQVPIIITSSVFMKTDLSNMIHGIGADAFLSMPCDNEEIIETTARALKSQAARHSPLVLVVDDDTSILRFLSAGLMANGYNVVKTDKGTELMEMFYAHKPDVVILDHHLGDINALDLLPELRKNNDVVLIAITAVSDPDIVTDYTQKGIDGFVRKPFTIRYLVDLINKTQRERVLQRVEHILEARTQSLRKAEEQFRDLYDNAPVGYHTLDEDGIIISMNKTELKWLGYQPDEIVGKKTIFDLQTPLSAEKGRKVFKELSNTESVSDIELELVRKDGTMIPVLIESAIHENEKGSSICRTIVRDISERRRLEEQLRHAQKMESLGVMAEGIAHNFKNLLTPILITADDMMNSYEKDSDEHTAMKDIVEASRRGSALVKQLTTLGKSSDSFRRVDAGKIVSDTVGMLEKTLDKAVKIETSINTDELVVVGDEGQIQQALMNLCFNASDAMPQGGRLSIATRTAEITSETLSLSIFATLGKFLVISVADTGSGMTPEIKGRIFDPFFTTKGLAKGTGLGLSTTYSIIQDHGGFIHVYSEPGEGSTFRIYLPIIPESNTETTDDIIEMKPEVPPSPSDSAHITHAGNECILLIDDEPDVLRSAGKIISKAGYTVLKTEDGITGLEMIRESLLPEESDNTIPKINLVILDVVMPNMSGEKVLQRLRGISSEIPVIISSGYGATQRVTDFLKQGAQSIIEKPFDKETLLRTIREVLNDRNN